MDTCTRKAVSWVRDRKPFWRAAVVWLTALTFALSPVALASSVPAEGSSQELPCHMTMGAADAAMDNGVAPADQADTTDAMASHQGSAKPHQPGCPMMQGAMCLALCAVSVPSYDLAAPQPVRGSRPAFRNAASSPHILPPPQRPPNTL
jgi:hypothetical protein